MNHPRRIYPLSPKELTEEELAVVFAMTSRRPEPFDEIARVVTAEKAADFHEKWVLGYGHASVAEHAILHMAVENISRLAADSLEDNRLASYTEKSSRFQLLERGYYYVPPELFNHPLEDLFIKTCDLLFETYHDMVQRTVAYLRARMPQEEGERESAYRLRLRRLATDSCRFLLPAATLTNIGVTMNARSMEHAIRKLLSSELAEEREIGEELKEKGRSITPTLIKYAERNEYLVLAREAQRQMGEDRKGEVMEVETPRGRSVSSHTPPSDEEVRLVYWDPEAENKVVAALLYRFSNRPYPEIWDRVRRMTLEEKEQVLDQVLGHLGPHDVPVRELEAVDYTLELVMDYGAYREFKRHRMQSYLPQPLTVELGYVVPRLLIEAGLEEEFHKAMEAVEKAYQEIKRVFPHQAPYLVTHAHKRRVLAKMNLRECYHIFKLRTGPQAHFTIRRIIQKAKEVVQEKHPLLLKHLRTRME